MNWIILFVLAMIALTGSTALSQESPSSNEPAPPASSATIDLEATRLGKIVTAIRITEEISLDGRLDEPA